MLPFPKAMSWLRMVYRYIVGANLDIIPSIDWNGL
jgi:hypothetical protein